VIKTMVLAALVAGLSACGSDSGGGSSSGSVPQGFKRLDGPGYTLA